MNRKGKNKMAGVFVDPVRNSCIGCSRNRQEHVNKGPGGGEAKEHPEWRPAS
jgi:hypothetical protein